MINVISDKRLKKAILGLARFQEVKWVKIFGSRSRGDNGERSDYDIAIDFDSDSTSVWIDIVELLDNATLLPLDIIDYRKAGDEIRGHIDAQGKLVLLNEKWFISLVRLGNALDSLDDIIDDPDDAKHVLRDSVLTRFEYTIELFWKTFKHLAEMKGDIIKFPRDAIKRAYQVGWVDNDEKWLQMLEDRNRISHSYDEDIAEDIYQNIKRNFPELKKIYNFLKEQNAY